MSLSVSCRGGVRPAVLCVAAACFALGGLTGCNVYRDTINPSFPVTEADAQADERRMRAEPVPLERPVLVVGGYRSPDPIIESMKNTLVRMTSGDPADFKRIAMWIEPSMETAAAQAVEALEEKFPSGDPERTVEVDVVAVSMGGLVSRYAADRRDGKRLNINRLFTIATPHRGAVLAENSPLVEDPAVHDMYRRSLFLVKLDEAYDGSYEIIPYTRLEDGVVGPINTAPPGRWPIWVSGPVVGGSHLTVNEDRRILTDIARRLRGEEPRGIEGEPLPESAWDPD